MENEAMFKMFEKVLTKGNSVPLSKFVVMPFGKFYEEFKHIESNSYQEFVDSDSRGIYKPFFDDCKEQDILK